jgi:hypothetical protein
VREPLAIFGGILAGLGLSLGMINILAAVSSSTSNAWHLAPSQGLLTLGFTLMGLGVGLMVATAVYKKLEHIRRGLHDEEHRRASGSV